MNNFRQFEKNDYPVDSAIHLSYNRSLVNKELYSSQIISKICKSIRFDNISFVKVYRLEEVKFKIYTSLSIIFQSAFHILGATFSLIAC